MTKTEAIMKHLQEYGNITSWEAIKEYGATRLSGVIYNLRNRYNMPIRSERVDMTDRYGNKGYYAKYILEEK